MQINFAAAEIFRGKKIYRQADNLAYAYETNFKAVDADGAPNAYNPQDTGPALPSRMPAIRTRVGGRMFWFLIRIIRRNHSCSPTVRSRATMLQ
jgi:hypothetical protein